MQLKTKNGHKPNLATFGDITRVFDNRVFVSRQKYACNDRSNW